jgi:hypothetical protein
VVVVLVVPVKLTAYDVVAVAVSAVVLTDVSVAIIELVVVVINEVVVVDDDEFVELSAVVSGIDIYDKIYKELL